jgi:hypothetical protein
VDIDFLITVMRERKYLDVDKIFASNTRLYVELLNIQKRKAEYIEVHGQPHMPYLEVMRAATSVPFLHPGKVKIHGIRYMETPLRKPSFHIEQAIADGCTDVLVVTNYPKQLPNNFEGSDNVFSIQPDASWKLSRLERRPVPLRQACVQMGTLVNHVFGIEKDISLGYEKL